jgi:uncharacterized membrane protein YidH (DUF202 family)
MIANDTNHAANERTFHAWIRAGLAAGAVVPVAMRSSRSRSPVPSRCLRPRSRSLC